MTQTRRLTITVAFLAFTLCMAFGAAFVGIDPLLTLIVTVPLGWWAGREIA